MLGHRQAGAGTVRVVGVVSSHATTYMPTRWPQAAWSRRLSPPSWPTGVACRVADPEALAVLAPHIDHIVQVSDAEVAAAMQAFVHRHPQRGRRGGRCSTGGGTARASCSKTKPWAWR